jgi:hypothetical protein
MLQLLFGNFATSFMPAILAQLFFLLFLLQNCCLLLLSVAVSSMTIAKAPSATIPNIFCLLISHGYLSVQLFDCSHDTAVESTVLPGCNLATSLKGIVSRDFEVCFLIPLNSSDIATLTERVRFFLKWILCRIFNY